MAELDEIQKLLDSPIHEHRLTGLLILEIQYSKGDDVVKKRIFLFFCFLFSKWLH